MPVLHLIPVIEDDEPLRLALIGLLQMMGYRTSGHASSEGFLAADGAQGAACILCDICLPGISGIELKRRLDAAGVGVPVIMMTARTDPSLAAAAIAAGAVAVLSKPFDADRLLESLTAALKGR